MSLLEIEGLTKLFAGTAALRDVSLNVRAGEVHGLMGENGAGKSTLLKILSGAQPPTSGRMRFGGEEFAPRSPSEAMRRGVVTIYQELSLIPTLSVAENIFIGRAPRRMGLVDWRGMRARAREIIGRVGLTIDPETVVSALSVAEQQMVEIARALSLSSRLIIMDEPTSALSEAEVTRLLRIMGQLRDEGLGIMFVTHRLEEAASICDRMTVLRDGRGAGSMERGGTGRIEVPGIIEKMVGRAASELYARPVERHEPGETLLSIRGLRTRRDPDAPNGIVLDGVDLDLRAGEILGIAGLVGSGRTELARAIFGADPVAEGKMTLVGEPYSPASPADAIARGIGLVPEDRKHQAIFPSLPILANFSVASLDSYANLFGFMREGRERSDLTAYRKQLAIRMASAEQTIDGLSGGNQQKVILARWLTRDPKVLIVDEPTRGVDVGAKAEVHQILVQLAARGIAVMVISSELPEVLAVSDRIVTMRQGRITGEMPAGQATEARLMRLMALDQQREQRREFQI